MVKKTKLGSTKRFGPRYGRRNREKVAILEMGHRGKHKCPYCNYVKVVRLSRGIWHCEKCNAEFTGKAYSFEVPKQVVPVAPKAEEEEKVEEEETYEDEPEEAEVQDEQPQEDISDEPSEEEKAEVA